MRVWLLAALAGLIGCSTAPIAPIQRGQQPLKPQVERELPESLVETSGLAEYQGRFWSVNDGGNPARLFSLAGQQWMQLTPGGVANIDWEAMAQNELGLYLLDCGNNPGNRIWMQSYFFTWDSLQTKQPQAQRTDFRWSDAEPGYARRQHNNDCEAAAWVEGQLWLFSKNWLDQQTRVYRVNADQAQQTLDPFATLPVSGLITGADYNTEYQQLVLLGYGNGLAFLRPFVWFVPVADQQINWAGAKHYSLSEVGQWEAILWRQDQLYLTRESSPLGRAVLAKVAVPKAQLQQF